MTNAKQCNDFHMDFYINQPKLDKLPESKKRFKPSPSIITELNCKSSYTAKKILISGLQATHGDVTCRWQTTPEETPSADPVSISLIFSGNSNRDWLSSPEMSSDEKSNVRTEFSKKKKIYKWKD
ncbi:hypothetical protein ACET3Z_003868 [Daucus carota]